MKDKLMGPSSDFGWSRCHGCSATMNDRGMIKHSADCPGTCMRENCEWHR